MECELSSLELLLYKVQRAANFSLLVLVYTFICASLHDYLKLAVDLTVGARYKMTTQRNK